MSIPMILASKSQPRRDVLYAAGICPTIRVSHVDEPAALEKAAAERGVTVDQLNVEQRVMILAEAKAQAVHQAYRDVADAAASATGERVIAYPLQAAELRGEMNVADIPRQSGAPLDYSKAPIAMTRDFSGVDMPTVTEPISNVIAMQPGLTRASSGPLIVGCDSMFLLDGECYGKPHSVEVARERLRRMSGLDRPVERGPRGIGARRQDRRQRSRAAQGERASARRRLDRLRMRAQALGIERCLRRAARAA